MELILLLSALCFALFLGYSDGYMKRKNTINHWVKIPIYLSVGVFCYYPASIMQLFGFMLLFKPLFDIGWSAGAGYKYIYVGETSITDIVIRKLGLYDIERNTFPIITLIYFLLVFFASGIIVAY